MTGTDASPPDQVRGRGKGLPVIEERAELTRTGRVLEFSKRLGLDLADALAGD